MTVGVADDVACFVGTDEQGSDYVIGGEAPNGAPSGRIISNVPTTAIYVDGVCGGIGGTVSIALQWWWGRSLLIELWGVRTLGLGAERHRPRM